MKFFSYKNRPVNMGPLPIESLKLSDSTVNASKIASLPQLTFKHENPNSLIHAIGTYATILDAARNGEVSDQKPEISSDLIERSDQLKSFGYFMDALHIGCCKMTPDILLPQPYINSSLAGFYEDMGKLPEDSPGFHHLIAQGLQDGISQNNNEIQNHTHTLVLIFDHSREIKETEAGFEWLSGAGRHRASIRASEAAVVLANYIRALGYEARAHTESTTDIDLAKAAVLAGTMDLIKETKINHPYLGDKFSIAAVTTCLEIAVDQPLAPRNYLDKYKSHGPSWWLGIGRHEGKKVGTSKNAFNLDPYKRTSFDKDIYGMSKLKRQDHTSTIVDEERIPRLPKRSDIFWRGNYGDMGKIVQEACVDEFCVVKTASAEAQYSLIGAMHLFERKTPDTKLKPVLSDPEANAKKIKSALHFLGVDMVGISRAPAWVWYSHDLDGSEIIPAHENAITILIDQGHETMEGASGDDWIAVAQSMRAYLRGLFLGGVIAEQIKNLGYEATTHSVVDSDVLHPPLVLLSGLGETSRIGDVVLNPFLGPRLKTLVITTNMPLKADKPIDFGLQEFCNSCKKCARECPSGAITAGPKVMFNGYETWKADVEKCGRYRMTQDKGAMCGRCMKTCPWNLEGLFVDSAFRWLGMKVPKAARLLTALDDKFGNGRINPIKKWWWDIETTLEGVKQAVPTERINVRELNVDLDLKREDQTLACYPADMAPAPIPVVQIMDRDAAIERYEELLSPEEYLERLKNNDTDNLVPSYNIPADTIEVQYLKITKREMSAEGVVKFELERQDNGDLTPFTAGAHIDIVIDAPFTRQYSLAGDPKDTKKYVIGILKEPEGRGGSIRAHERLFEGAIIPVTGPRNHFPLEEKATRTLLFGGGIGVTPMIAMAHRLHDLGSSFDLYYCARSRRTAGFIDELLEMPWRDNVHLHISDEGTRADLEALIGPPDSDKFLYTCGPNPFMEAVLKTGEDLGWNEDNLRKEYFSAPDHGEYENVSFKVELTKSERQLEVPPDKSLADVLQENNIPVTTKCSDGICGVCKINYIKGDIEHRDFVLSKKEKEESLITCCSRAKPDSGPLVLEL